MSDDAQWLRQFADEGSEEAFRQLVEHHLPMVNSTARRIVAGDAYLAQDVTQIVFTDLARKAATLPEGVVLGGWLYRHACYTAMKAIRSENRRRARERTAMEINALNDSSAGDAHWLQLAPVLDDALNQLDAVDRDAIVLRYLQQRDVRSIGLALGASENAAQKRLGRALEKLRAILTRRGVTVSTVLLSTALDAGAATTPMSAGLAASISANALVGASATATTATLLTSLKTMITSKLAIGAAAFAVGVITTVIVTQNGQKVSPAPAAAPTPAISKTASAPVVQVATSKVEAPKAAPVAPQNADAPAPDAGASSDPFAAAAPVIPRLATVMSGGGVGGGSGGGALSFGTVSSGTLQIKGTATPFGNGTLQIKGAATPFGNNGTMMISTNEGVTQMTDNGDGTMTITLPDGSTRTMPKPAVPTNVVDNGDGTATMTMSDGSTRIVNTGGGSGRGTIMMMQAPPSAVTQTSP